MQHQSIGQPRPQGQRRETLDNSESKHSLPSSKEVLFEFGVMLAVSLSLAVGARLLLLALDIL